ncbi:MAG: nucleoside triphosphate pyrophosphohydrolase [Gemmatimonadales bacterium]|nr:nucleoside triphosphate pyrophosphohydrolase [Candidatus Palauibacter irciniicola]MYC19348.1 nucleoside triphosphate pyrophosphohydrolase [Gemmatimonadales bacterium]
MQEPTAAADIETLHAEEAREGDDALARALALVRFLRLRCPWDAEQTPQTLRPYLLEEAHEVADAIRAGDDAGLRGELGDLLLNVAFQIVLAEERGAFAAADVVEALEAKMEARHPHVYGDADAPPDWESLKAAERESPDDPFHGVSRGLDPLSRAARVQERMAGFGFDWPDLAGPVEKVREETAELERAAAEEASGSTAPAAPPRIGEASPEVVEEVGDLLFAVVNASRWAGVHPANALLGAVEKFERRCRRMIERAESRGLDWKNADLATLDAVWEEVKADE